MRKENLLLLLWPVLLIGACTCPPDEKTDSLSLSSEARAFVPYTGQETLTFDAPDGQSLTFTAPKGEEVGEDRLCTRNICTAVSFGSPSSCEYTGAESRRYTYFTADNNAVLDVLVYSGQNEANSTDWFDAVQVAFSAGTPSTAAHHIINQRFTGTLKTTELGISRYFNPLDSIRINGQLFTHVLQLQEGSLGVYMQPTKGVVALTSGGKNWLLRP